MKIEKQMAEKFWELNRIEDENQRKRDI